jgi:hypothetical protein
MKREIGIKHPRVNRIQNEMTLLGRVIMKAHLECKVNWLVLWMRMWRRYMRRSTRIRVVMMMTRLLVVRGFSGKNIISIMLSLAM